MKIHYKIKSENYEFYATITEIENHKYRIKFGGARQCINVSVYKDSIESSLANLNGVSYDLECSIDKNLLAGDGTVRPGLYFIDDIFERMWSHEVRVETAEI